MAEMTGDDLQRRYRSAVVVVSAMFALTALVVVLAFMGVVPGLLVRWYSSTVAGALWFSIIAFGLGAVAVRRARFTALRLQAIADLRGVAGLLATLQQTTIIVALLGGAISVLGYALTLLTRDSVYTRNAAIIAIAVLVYCYPRRSAWQRVVALAQQPGGLTAPPPAKGTTA